MPTTVTGALQYQLDDGRCGCLHEAGDLEALADHLRTLMASASLRETYMTRARARMLSLFVWERYFPELEIQFRQLLEI